MEPYIHVPYKKEFEPIVLPGENIAVAKNLDEAEWEYYKVKYVEPFFINYTTPTITNGSYSDISIDEMVQGWRVQIGFFKMVDNAIEVSDKVSSMLDEGVYLDFDAPYHKVRVGDCTSRKDAMELLQKVRKLGFSDAFIIPTMVYKYPELRRQREEETRKAEQDTTNIPSKETDMQR